jgi:hypothetical protein
VKQTGIRCWINAGLGLLLLVCVLPTTIGQDRVDERQLKTAFIYNFAKFTRWPKSTAASGTFALCIAGSDPTASSLNRLSGRKVKGRTVTIQSVSSAQSATGCQMLYFATSKQGSYRSLLNSLKTQPILTVSEIPRFSQSGGGIELYMRSGRLRFRINQGAAGRAGLGISSRLLKLSKSN